MLKVKYMAHRAMITHFYSVPSCSTKVFLDMSLRGTADNGLRRIHRCRFNSAHGTID